MLEPGTRTAAPAPWLAGDRRTVLRVVQTLRDLEQARTALDDAGIVWHLETDPDAKRQLLGLLFEKVWLDERRVVAVQP